MSEVHQATKDYEAFLGDHLPVVEADLALKHEQMKKALFPFMRSTFYRWSALFPQICPELAGCPEILAVGDLHIENFGTWRDQEGRLVWGVNDVDEAQTMPYAIDLVRLATSAILSNEDGHLGMSSAEIATAILEGYGEWLTRGGAPFVLEEGHDWLRKLAINALRDPPTFWAKLEKNPDCAPPTELAALLHQYLPEKAEIRRVTSRTAGLGSLGRPRFVALADFGGALVAREAKAMLPSGWSWSRGDSKAPLCCGKILAQALRCQDPCLHFVTADNKHGGWVIRRLAPHCSRVEMADLPKDRDHDHLLRTMGRETANIHLGSQERIADLRHHLAAQKPGWLAKAATAMAEATRKDWQDWRG